MTEPGGIVPEGTDPDASPGEAARIPSRWRAAIFALAAAGVIGAGAWVVFGSPLLAVRSVSVRGTHLVPSSEVLAVSGVTPGTPLILVNTGRAALRIDTITQIRSAQVTRSWPDQVVIVVRERSPALAVAAPARGYDLVDADGVMLRWSARRPADLPLYPAATPVAALRGDPDLTAAAAVLGELPAGVRRSVISVTAPGPDQVTLRLAGGITVLWGDTGRAGDKARELTAVMRGHMRYYDVSAPGSVLAR